MSRASRAQARAARQARNPPPAPVVDDEAPMDVLNGPTSNNDKYRSTDEFMAMLQRIGVSRRCMDQLLSDDFDSMEVLVSQYKDDIKEFHTYLKNINKGAMNGDNPTRFSPVVMDRLLAVTHFFIQAAVCFHMLPDLELIDRDRAMALIEPYRIYIKFKDEEIDDEVIIDLPELKGHENWISFRDKFMSNLSNTPGSNGSPLLYVVDRTERLVTRQGQPLIDTPTVALDDWDTYHQKMIHFGTHFKRDNSRVWSFLKKSLLGTQPYHHMDHCARQENGRRAWEALRSYYEGEDYINKTTQECLTRVRTMYYKGETPRFGFEKFIDKQKECYKRLRDVGYNNGLGVDDASKCSNLKQMILPEAHLETALSLARTQGLFNGPFDDLVHFLKAEVDEISLRRTQLRSNRSHRVSSVGIGRSGRGFQGGRGGRGGRGRGRRQPFSPRSRPLLTRIVDGRRVNSGNYSPEEYRRLTPAQREAVKALRRQARDEMNAGGAQRDERRAGVSSVTFSPPENTSDGVTHNEPSEGSLGRESGVSSVTAPSGSVGSYLGSRRNHRNSPSSSA